MSEKQSALDSVNINLIDLSKAEFYVTQGGFTGLKYDGTDYKHVTLRRALPMGRPMEYISVADGSGDEVKEIGILRSVNELAGKQLEIVANELNTRYYCPAVIEIKSVKDKLGYVYMELKLSEADGGHVKNCAVKDVNKNIRMLGEDGLIIFDVDGNRFIVKSLPSLDKNSLKRIEPYMF